MLAVVLAAVTSVSAQVPPAVPSASACRSSIVGTVRTIRLQGNVFPGERTLRIWLPPGYDASGSNATPCCTYSTGRMPLTPAPAIRATSGRWTRPPPG